MKKAWGVILTIVLVAVLLGAVAIGVGFMTGGDMARIYTSLEGTSLYDFVQALILLWNEAITAAANAL